MGSANDTGWKYRFAESQCVECPCRDRCIAKTARSGRTVIKNQYEPQYRQMRAKAETDEYAAVRGEHPKIERKLSELVRRHGARRTRYRGLAKVLCGHLMTATVVNIKRIVNMLHAPIPVLNGA